MRILIVIGFICGASSLRIAQQARPHWMEEDELIEPERKLTLEDTKTFR